MDAGNFTPFGFRLNVVLEAREDCLVCSMSVEEFNNNAPISSLFVIGLNKKSAKPVGHLVRFLPSSFNHFYFLESPISADLDVSRAIICNSDKNARLAILHWPALICMADKEYCQVYQSKPDTANLLETCPPFVVDLDVDCMITSKPLRTRGFISFLSPLGFATGVHIGHVDGCLCRIDCHDELLTSGCVTGSSIDYSYELFNKIKYLLTNVYGMYPRMVAQLRAADNMLRNAGFYDSGGCNSLYKALINDEHNL